MDHHIPSPGSLWPGFLYLCIVCFHNLCKENIFLKVPAQVPAFMVKYLFLIKGMHFPSQINNTVLSPSYFICINAPFLLSVNSSKIWCFFIYTLKRPICIYKGFYFLISRNGRKLLGFFFPAGVDPSAKQFSRVSIHQSICWMTFVFNKWLQHNLLWNVSTFDI